MIPTLIVTMFIQINGVKRQFYITNVYSQTWHLKHQNMVRVLELAQPPPFFSFFSVLVCLVLLPEKKLSLSSLLPKVTQ